MNEKCPICDGRGRIAGGCFDPEGKAHEPAIIPEMECRFCFGVGSLDMREDNFAEMTLQKMEERYGGDS